MRGGNGSQGGQTGREGRAGEGGRGEGRGSPIVAELHHRVARQLVHLVQPRRRWHPVHQPAACRTHSTAASPPRTARRQARAEQGGGGGDGRSAWGPLTDSQHASRKLDEVEEAFAEVVGLRAWYVCLRLRDDNVLLGISTIM